MLPCTRLGCRQMFNNRMARSRHIKRGQCQGRDKTSFAAMAEISLEDQFKCSKCQKVIKHRNNFARHMKVCLSKSKVQCLYCSQEFKNKSQLKRHFDNVHKCTKPFQCSSCGKGFKTANVFDKHIVTCTSR